MADLAEDDAARLARFRRLLPAYSRALGMELVAASPDRIAARLVVRPEIGNGMGALHGGALMALADTLGAFGTIANLARGRKTVTLESKTNFLAAAPVGSVVLAEATPLHRGRTTQVWQTTISRDDGKPVAIVTQTQLVLAPPDLPAPAGAG